MLHPLGGLKGAVREQAVVAAGDAQAAGDKVEAGEQEEVGPGEGEGRQQGHGVDAQHEEAVAAVNLVPAAVHEPGVLLEGGHVGHEDVARPLLRLLHQPAGLGHHLLGVQGLGEDLRGGGRRRG